MSLDQVSQSILYIIIILVFAKVFGELAERIGQTPVLGELVAGVILGTSVLGWIRADRAAALAPESSCLIFLAELGVIILLFEVGLESDLEDFLRVGWSAILVAMIGVVGPFAFGYYSSILLGLSYTSAIFMGAALTATSVGITARTLGDLGQMRTSAAKIILGAAVIDDVIGLIILAVVGSLVAGDTVSFGEVGKVVLLAVAFLVGGIAIGIPLAPHMLGLAKKLRTRGMLTISAFLFCLTLAYFAHELGLAAIVGAFAAGLVLARTEDLVHIQQRIKPIADIFVPIFFVMLGVSVNLSVMNPLDPHARGNLAFIGILVFVAVAMKVVAGLGVLKRGVSRLVVGVGMIPRGEVGLIFASIGLTRNIISSAEYAAIVAVVIITTFITPPLLKLVLASTKSIHAET